MAKDGEAAFVERTLDDLVIDDESSFRHVAIYSDLKEVLRRADYKFRVLSPGPGATWDRALFLNLTFWAAKDGGDVLVDHHIPADVVAHAAWHHLAAAAFASDCPGAPSREALFLGEAIASAFDVYLVGRLLAHAPRSAFLKTQVPAMAEAAEVAGLSRGKFEALLAGIAAEPEQAFRDLRELLSDATAALAASPGAGQAAESLRGLGNHRFGSLLHRYELSNWILYARAYGTAGETDPRPRAVDRALRDAPGGDGALEWLVAKWVAPALGDLCH